MTDLRPLGDRGFLARFPCEDSAARWAVALSSLSLPGVLEVIPAYDSVGVLADPDRIDLDDLEARLRTLSADEQSVAEGRAIPIPVLYDGPDLGAVAGRLGLSETEVVSSHSGSEYRVFAIGFLPGFPYAGYLPASLSGLGRLDSPRERVPAGSVALVGRQTGIYPVESPGGWHLIGRTPLRIVDLPRAYFPIRAGDRLRFVPITPEEFAARQGEFL